MSDKESLPPEPRVQGAPGFGVDGPNGRINIEFRAPQSEYWELQKEWKKIWKDGMKDPKTGAISALSIEDAKKRLLSQNLKSKTGAEAEAAFNASRMSLSDSSSGRKASEKRR